MGNQLIIKPNGKAKILEQSGHSVMNNLNILIVQEGDKAREALVAGLSSLGYGVCGIVTLSALNLAISADLILWNSTRLNAQDLDILRQIRQRYPDIGLIVITAGLQREERLECYQQGADLYLVQPLSIEELGGAIQALARRLPPKKNHTQLLILNPETLQLRGPHATVDLSRRECTLLTAWTRAPDRLLDNAQLFTLAGLTTSATSKSTLEVQIVRLRKKLECAGVNFRSIRSIRGYGYQLCVSLYLELPTK